MSQELERNNRLGRINFPLEWVWAAAEPVRQVMSDSVVIHCEANLGTRRVEYIIINDAFSEVATGEEIPEYIATITRNDDGSLSHEFQRHV